MAKQTLMRKPSVDGLRAHHLPLSACLCACFLPAGGKIGNNHTRMEIPWVVSFQLLNGFESINVNTVCLQRTFLDFVIFCRHWY